MSERGVCFSSTVTFESACHHCRQVRTLVCWLFCNLRLHSHFTSAPALLHLPPLRGSSSSYLRFLIVMIMDTPSTSHSNFNSPISAQIESTGASVNVGTLPETGSTAQQRPSCVACTDEIEAVCFTAPCAHSYCDDCLASLMTFALEPAGSFPPVCCDLPITLQSAQAHLHHDLVKRWQKKHSEIIASCTLVCAKSGCRVVIYPENIVDGLGHYVLCNNDTCNR